MRIRERLDIPMDELALFGSVLRHDVRDDSDSDVLVEFQPGARAGFFTLSALGRELAMLFGRSVDVGSRRCAIFDCISPTSSSPARAAPTSRRRFCCCASRGRPSHERIARSPLTS